MNTHIPQRLLSYVLKSPSWRRVVAKGAGEGAGWTRRLGLEAANYLEPISNEVLLYSSGNYIHSLGTERDGRWHEKRMHVYARQHHYAEQQKWAQHCQSTITKKETKVKKNT